MGHALDCSGIHSKEYFSDTKKIFHYEGKVMHRRYIAIHIYMYEHCLAVLEISCTNCWHLESQNKYLDQFISLLAACVLKGSFLKID